MGLIDKVKLLETCYCRSTGTPASRVHNSSLCFLKDWAKSFNFVPLSSLSTGTCSKLTLGWTVSLIWDAGKGVSTSVNPSQSVLAALGGCLRRWSSSKSLAGSKSSMCILPRNVYLSQNRFQPLFMRKVITICLLDPEKGVEEASHLPWELRSWQKAGKTGRETAVG